MTTIVAEYVRRCIRPPQQSFFALRGLRAVAGLEALVRRTLVYTGERRMRTDDGIDILPLPSFLEELADGRIWE